MIAALIGRAPTPAQRTLPPKAELLQFYVLANGTAVADFSEALPTQVPSGILSEQLVVDSLARTLGANIPAISRLKILIHGQEAETLAGHVDLSGFFPVEAPPAADTATPSAASGPQPVAGTPPAVTGVTPQPATSSPALT